MRWSNDRRVRHAIATDMPLPCLFCDHPHPHATHRTISSDLRSALFTPRSSFLPHSAGIPIERTEISTSGAFRWMKMWDPSSSTDCSQTKRTAFGIPT
ncbi:hypothetical protein V9T40_010723 [Parthenolecanium corni]|uniref:Uncharacterized protein n=1 Tax=Parthenolecanium corni TaxID=536013 RepID=A0AAN9TH97_9HEMI